LEALNILLEFKLSNNHQTKEADMDELMDLRRSIEQGRYDDALTIIGEMDEMAKDDKINKIGSYMVILLVHLIKHYAEKRMTRSWRTSILNALSGISKSNKRRVSGGYYMTETELCAALNENIDEALRSAASEAFGGVYDEKEFVQMFDIEQVLQHALKLIVDGYSDIEFVIMKE
jgi:hypothetical protein